MNQVDLRTWVVAIVIGGVAHASHGAAPVPGLYSTHFDGAQAVWDVSGNFAQDVLGAGLNASLEVSQNAKGKLAGGGSVSYSSSNEDIAIDFTINGTVANSAGVITVNMLEHLHGAVTVNGKTYNFNGNLDNALTLDPLAQTLNGVMTGSMCVAGHCETMEQMNGGQPYTINMSLPSPAMDGSWDLDINVVSVTGAKVVATATVTLANGRTLTLAGKGKYSPTTDLTTLTFKGSTPTSKGNQLRFTVQGADLGIVRMTGKLLGQTPTITP